MRRPFGNLLILFWLSLLSSAIAAQDLPENRAANNLILEVTYFKGTQPASQKIGADARAGSSAWYARFQRVNGWQPKAGEFPVRAVNLVPYFEPDGAVKVRVSVFTGERFHDNEVFVADASLRENERKTITELTKFGVEPFEVAVVAGIREAADLPSIVNKTTSLQVLVEPEVSELPRFKVKLLNNSNKEVAAVALETAAGDRKLISAMPQGKDGKPLIAPNETFVTSVPNNIRALDETPQNYSLVVGAVVFTDGTYEGDPQKAASFRSFVIGRKAFLKRALPLWQKVAAGKLSTEGLSDLKNSLNALGTASDGSDLAQLFREFPGLDAKAQSRLTTGVEAAQHSVKKSMLDDLANFGQENDKSEEFAQRWLSATIEKYRNLLTRLSL